jgi:hypothetical protein
VFRSTSIKSDATVVIVTSYLSAVLITELVNYE